MSLARYARALLPLAILLAPGVLSSAQSDQVADLDTVFLTVSVTGKGNNSVPGIGRERFQVLEDGVDQQITYFLEDSRPITVGFIFDDSLRMARNNKYYVLEEAAQSFLKTKDPRDEYFVVNMADNPVVAVSFATDISKLPVVYGAIGATMLYDAVYVGLSVIKEAANPRKHLVVITSGGDPTNKTTEVTLQEFALKQPVQIHTLFIVEDLGDSEAEMIHRDANVLNLLANMTGGQFYNAPIDARGVEALMAEIARGLKTQYLVGYKSTRPARDGKRRGVKVKVSALDGESKLNVLTKAGYYTHKDK